MPVTLNEKEEEYLKALATRLVDYMSSLFKAQKDVHERLLLNLDERNVALSARVSELERMHLDVNRDRPVH